MQNTKLIKKISTSLVSTGEIIDSLQSNSSTSAPSIRAVVDNMTPPMNLLINGDFKINQRGNTSYEKNDSTWIYSIDLWRINGMKLQVNSDETITLTALNETNYFQQIIENADYQTGDTLILSVYIDGSIKTFNIHIGTTDYIDEKISIFASYNQEQKKMYLSLSLNQQSNYITLKWIQLNEGTVVYPHVEEDDVTALIRCQKFFIRKGISTVPYYKYGSGEDLRLGGEIPSMESVPTVNITGCFSFDNASAVNTIRSVTSVYVSDTFYLDARVVFAKPMHPSCYGVILVCEISCEPK